MRPLKYPLPDTFPLIYVKITSFSAALIEDQTEPFAAVSKERNQSVGYSSTIAAIGLACRHSSYNVMQGFLET